jgi:Ca2+-binding EF-hand superfamily protein
MVFASRLRCIGLAGLIMTAIANAPQAAAQAPAAPPSASAKAGEQQLFLQLRAGITLELYFEGLREDFFNLDADLDGKLTQRDVDLHVLMESIQMRTAAWTAVMRYDLDGDGFVTEDEVRRVMRYETRLTRARAAIGKGRFGDGEEWTVKIVRSIMELDTDKDGKVSLTEASKFAQPTQQRNMGITGYSARTRHVLTLDNSGAGELSLADYEAAGEMLFRKIDTDNDGKISQQEHTDYWRGPAPPKLDADAAQKRQRDQAEIAKKRQEAIDAQRAVCAMPSPSPNAKVIVFSSYQTGALSSVTIGSQDVVVFAGRVVVEPGSEPLYVVIPTFTPVIWQFSGAVDRIERLVVSSAQTLPDKTRYDGSQPVLAGATGLPQDKVSFLRKVNCLSYFAEVPSSQSVRTVAAVREAIGREPFKTVTAYSLREVSIPSGEIKSPDAQSNKLIIEKSSGSLRIEGDASNFIVHAGPSRARDDLYRYHPGGLVEIDPKSVVSSLPAQAYEVFPQEAGLVQLLESGALTQNRAGEYIVQKKMRFPAGLAGAHSVKFVVLGGTPVPDGDPGHSCVTVEEPPGDRKFEACR